MSKFQTIGRLSIFVHDKKGNVNAPDFSGKLRTLEGETLFIDLWEEPVNGPSGTMLKGVAKKRIEE